MKIVFLGANVNCIKSSTEDQWLLPLKVAVQQHQPSIVEYLLQNGSHVNFKESTRGGIEFLKAAVAETGKDIRYFFVIAVTFIYFMIFIT